ncbi:copper chaperone PCu(A)C [Gallaecimonas sp. GXIMD4217]|uniref:copper chaperone PCu(A)C n=1 Tax=Gallaecimonas sp. GXIMD4217 TaxID=3131927 RepID=UPI00311AE54A
MLQPLLGLLLLAESVAPVPLEVSDAWVRAMPPGQHNSAAYMRLHNPGDEPLVLVGAESPGVGHIMLHGYERRGDQLAMKHLDRLVLAPGQETLLAPGTSHLMLMGLKAPLREGDSLALTLILANGQHQALELPVRRLPME